MSIDTQLTDHQREVMVLEQVASMVETFTYYHRSHFKDLVSNTERVPVTAHQNFRVVFRIDEVSGTGRLPDSSVDAGSAAAAWAQVNEQKTNAEKILPLRLEYWLESKGTNPQAPFQEADCFQRSQAVGYDYHCHTCQGKGSTLCYSCNGQRQLICLSCHGNKHVTCRSCKSGKQTCFSCGGRGRWQEARTRIVYTGTHEDQVQTTETYYETVICSGCGGSGELRCMNCGGSASLPCGTCEETGIVDCSTCKASGRLSCQKCEGTGWQHIHRQLRATVTTRFSVAAATDHAESQRTLQAQESIADFLAMADGITPGYQRSTENTIDLTFKGYVDVTVLSFNAAGFTEEIIGYGTPPRVLDLKNIVVHLLQDTLSEMEQVLHATPRYLPWLSPRLSSLLTAFFASETNQQIGKRAAGGFDDAAKIAARDFRNAVSVDYVARAITAIHEGIERIYWSSVVPGILALFFVPTLLLVLGDMRGIINFGPVPALAVGIGAVIFALALEQYSKWHVRKRIQHAFKGASDDLLKDIDLLRRGARWIRWVAIIGAFIGWIGGAMILAAIFTTNDNARQKLQTPPRKGDYRASYFCQTEASSTKAINVL